MALSPIERLIDASGMRCAICNAPRGQCDCWTKCKCGWSFEKGTACRNPEHAIAEASRTLAVSVAEAVIFEMRDKYPEPMKWAAGGFRKTLREVIRREAESCIRAAFEGVEHARQKDGG